MPITATVEQSFWSAFLTAAVTAAQSGLEMTVLLKSDELLEGIPLVETMTAETLPYGQAVTVGGTDIIAHEVRAFGLALL
jgi:hypothetical protein